MPPRKGKKYVEKIQDQRLEDQVQQEKPRKKKVYVEKEAKQQKLTKWIDKQKKQKNQEIVSKPNNKEQKTRVVNVRVKFLRMEGYNNLLQWLEDPNHIYIGRNMTYYVPGAVGSKWANPFKVNQVGRQSCVQRYRKHILSDKKLSSELKELKGKVLGCWCAPESCHGHILAELADNL